MGGSLILQTAARALLPLLLTLSVFLLLRGHDEPGGGFIGGLVGASAFVLYVFAFDSATSRRMLMIDPRTMMGVGLLFGALAGIPALLLGQGYLAAQWWDVRLGPLSLNTPLIFDIGVYLVVIGFVLTIVYALAEADGG